MVLNPIILSGIYDIIGGFFTGLLSPLFSLISNNSYGSLLKTFGLERTEKLLLKYVMHAQKSNHSMLSPIKWSIFCFLTCHNHFQTVSYFNLHFTVMAHETKMLWTCQFLITPLSKDFKEHMLHIYTSCFFICHKVLY